MLHEAVPTFLMETRILHIFHLIYHTYRMCIHEFFLVFLDVRTFSAIYCQVNLSWTGRVQKIVVLKYNAAWVMRPPYFKFEISGVI